jgi:type I restriction enzyme S subunit
MKAVEGTNNWKNKSLRDLATINYGRSPSDILSEDGPYPVVGTGGSERLGNDYLHEGESIILGRKGTIDRVYFATGRFWTIDTAYYLSGFGDTVPRWLFYYLQTLDLRQMNEATGVPSLSRDLLYKIEIPTPPKPEQSKIAEILLTVDQAIEQTEALIAKQQRIKTGLMQDLLTRGLDEHGNLRSEQTHKFKDSLVGRIPVEWEVKKIEDVFEIQLGKMLSQKAAEGNSPFYYLGNKNVQWDRIETSDMQMMDFDERERYKYDLRLGDILVCEGGEIGRTAIWRGEVENCYYQKAIHRLRPINQQYLSGLFPRFMRWATRRGSLSDFTSQTSIAHLTQEKLAKVPIMVPSITEQENLTALFDKFDHDLDNQSTKLTKFRSLKTALMQGLLTGRKRVTALLNDMEVVTS